MKFLSVCFLGQYSLVYNRLTFFPIICTVTSVFNVNFVDLNIDNG